jgi:hypothetical protein
VASSSRRGVGIAAAIAALLAITSTVTFLSANATAEAKTICTRVLFVGVRGSGEPVGLGSTITQVYNSFKGRIGETVGIYALVYPATHQPVGNSENVLEFKKSVDTGTAALKQYLATQITRCPNQKIVMTGYSQGALVVDRALAQSSTAVLNHMAGIALYGDPRFNPSFAGNVGTYDKGNNGVIKWLLPSYGGSQYLPASVAGKAKSYCISGDPVCSYSILNTFTCFAKADDGECAHQRYDNLGYTTQGASYLLSKVKK